MRQDQINRLTLEKENVEKKLKSKVEEFGHNTKQVQREVIMKEEEKEELQRNMRNLEFENEKLKRIIRNKEEEFENERKRFGIKYERKAEELEKEREEWNELY